MKRKTLRILFTTIILSIISLTFTPLTFAENSINVVKEKVINTEDLLLDQISYKNTTKVKETIKVTVSTYDSKTETVLTTKPFVGLSKTTYTLAAGATINNPYAISIPKDTPAGTYSNVIFIQKQSTGKPTGNVAVIQAIGTLLVFHVQDSTITLDQIFFNQSDIKLVVVKKGLPYISKTEFIYSYTNNSNYIFTPTGEIRILDNNEKQILDRIEINPEGKRIYPGETYEQTYSVDVWKSLKDVMSQKNIVAKTYGNEFTSPILNKVPISIMYQVGLIGIIALVIVITLLVVFIKSIISLVKSRKQQTL